MNLLLYTQACLSGIAFAVLLVQLLCFRHINLEVWYRFTRLGIGSQIFFTILLVAWVLGVHVPEPEVLAPIILLHLSNTAWLCVINLLMLIAIPACHMKR